MNQFFNSRNATRAVLLFTAFSYVCLAQTSPFGQAAQATSTETVAIAKWVGIIIAVIAGLTMAGGGAHGSHIGAKMTGLLIGLTLALFAGPIVAWVQSF